MKSSMSFVQAMLACLLLIVLASCGGTSAVPTEEQRQAAISQVPCLVVLPVEIDLQEVQEVKYDQAARLEKGAAYMDTVLAEQLNGRGHVRILSSRQLTALMPDYGGDRQTLIERIGSEVKCNAVLVTTLSRYQPRVGGDFGVEQPASVVFAMKLYDIRQGPVLWSTMFAETQQSLLSNLMSFGTAVKRGFKWVTAEEMVEQGIIDKIRECPYL
ncbi:hypothetical protein [Desulfofustis glycolicus]|uniref:Lipoprotein n=1 Tax=Desulfofustis glycolicus DSM 9705 TaxID=1121409 RepID=A0A1M5VV07_9BACT|nr:hypothetical protein [Desulfofustis glycolicus]MCB2216688.1 hypothetical protein [Desulfobulbaceae bacterium]SHH78814.1 hypothetical protein SAMN02745124_01923 [Desulfofustis glycolicus DSM 9705]